METSTGAEPRSPLSKWVWLLLATWVPLVLVASAVLSFAMAIGCGGDGGSPYVPRASPYGQFCSSEVSDAWWNLTLIVPAIIAGVAYLAAVTRRDVKPLLIGGVAVMLAFATALAPSIVLRDQCTSEELASGADCEQY